MSRSYKKHSIGGMTKASSEKEDKQLAHKRDRRANKVLLDQTADDSKLLNRKQTSSPWLMAKDGKKYFDPKKHPKEMRK